MNTLFLIVIVGKLYSGDIVWQLSNPYERMWPEISVIFPGLLVGLLQALVLVAVGVALSTRLPMILNVSVCFALYVIASVSGPLIDYLAREQSGLLKVTKVIYWVLPNLRNNTEIFSAIGLGKPIPLSFVAWASVYSLLYIFAAICVGVFLFQDRELG